MDNICTIPLNYSNVNEEAKDLETNTTNEFYIMIASILSWRALFDACHFILAAISVRKDTSYEFRRSYIIATWFSTILTSFAGGLITNFLFGK